MVIELSKTKRLYILHKVKPIDIALAIRHLSTMLKSGIGIEESIRTVTKQITDLMLQEVFQKILKDVEGGTSIADSMKKHKKIFSDLIISIIDVGEQGANLERNLIFLADYLKKNYELQKKVKGATTYPIIIVFLTILEMIGVVYFILPKLESVFNSIADIPEFTKFIMSAAGYVRENGAGILAVLFAAFVLYKRFMSSKIGKKLKDRISLVIPVLKNVNKGTIIATFSRTLGMLLESGIPLQKALSISHSILGNDVYNKIFTKIADEVKGGKSLAESMSKYPKHFPVAYVKMIEVGENTGTLEENLGYLYDFYTEEVLDLSNNLTVLLEPVLLIFVGALIGGLALLIITPIYQLTGSINAGT